MTPQFFSNDRLTISSLEIADIVERRHDNVKRSIKRCSDRGLFPLPAIDMIPNHAKGPATIQVYRLSKRDSIVAVAKLSPGRVGSLIDAWGRAETTLNEVLSALDAFEVPEDMLGMYVYAIRNTATGSIRLGISRNPSERLKQLQAGNDCDLEIVATRPAVNGFSDKKALLKRNADVRLSGEWFKASATL